MLHLRRSEKCVIFFLDPAPVSSAFSDAKQEYTLKLQGLQVHLNIILRE